MKRKFLMTIRGKIIIVTVTFTLAITVCLASVSFYLFQSYARKNLVQSTEFNLQLVAGVISQDIGSLETLSKWCSVNSDILSYLEDPDASAREALSVYDRFKEEYQNNRASGYVRRLLVTDSEHRRILQVGSSLNDTNPVNIYNLDRLFENREDRVSSWQSIDRDPYDMSRSPAARIIPLFRPIYRPSNHKVIGYVYLAVGTELITDQLSNYCAPPDSELTIRLGEKNYRIDGSAFTELPADHFREQSVQAGAALDPSTRVASVEFGDGGTGTLISCPVRSADVALSGSLSNQQLSQQKRVFLRILFLICLSMLFLGAFITVLLNRMINVPVEKMRRRMDAISKGNFAPDPEIEWDNELGDVGRGINKLSRNVVALMENRLADEKKKQDLEYRMLQNQINPHFLYNTLNSIKWMATIQNASGIAEMTTSLSRLLKSIAKGTEKIVPLREELSFLDDYFLIQQYRYGGALRMEKHIDGDVEDNAIPRFTLQPLLENAVFHGIGPKGGAGTVTVTARRADADSVEILMRDDGVGMDRANIDRIFSGGEDSPSGLFQQIGIRNVHRRIRYEYGDRYGVSIQSEPGVYTRARILLPRLPCGTAPAEGGPYDQAASG